MQKARSCVGGRSAVNQPEWQQSRKGYIMELMDRATVGLLDSSSYVMRNDKWCPVTMGMPKWKG